MSKRKIYFHIGFGKTGGSSLQSYLSFNSIHQTNKQEKLLYCCFDRDGRVFYGDEVSKMAKLSPLKYVASAPDIAELPDISVAKQELDKLFSQGFTPVFSQEDWGRRAGYFKTSNFFEQLDVVVHAIAYIRPQVEWFNSAWWQWFAWDGNFKKPEDVIAAWGYNFMLWGHQLSLWKRLPGVENVSVRLHPSDITEDFLHLLGVNEEVERANVEKVNVSLSPTLIKLLKKYPTLRQAHSADVDSILSKFIKFEGKTPWVIDAELASKIVASTNADNLKLLDMLDPPSRIIMVGDLRWWDAAHYKARKLWEEEDFQLKEEELSSIIEQVIPALINLGRNTPEFW